MINLTAKTKQLVKTIFLLAILFLAASCNNGNSLIKAAPASEATISVAKNERENPINFLKTEGSYRKNVARRWVVEGTITNTATETIYKEVVIKILYYNKAKAEIGSEEQTINDYFQPGRPKKFKVKSYGVYGAKSVGFQLISAKPLN